MKNLLLIALIALPSFGATLFTEDWSGETSGLTKTTLINWTVLNGTNLDVVNNGEYATITGCTARCVDLDGTGGSSNGDIETNQSFNFNVGITYTLSFTLGNNSGGSSNTARLRIGTSLVDQTFSAPSPNPGLLYTAVFTTAAPVSGKIRFTAGGTADNFGAILDNISLTDSNATVPEPSTWFMMAAGIGALGLRKRKS